ncbi:Signal peptidase I [Bertholletia excelsa]
MGLNFKRAWENILPFARFLCALHVTSTYICKLTLVYGTSMLPTISPSGELLLAERISPRFGKVGAGDIVLVRSPEEPCKVVTKRVKGIEGDRVTYIADPVNSDRQEITVVPEGHVWVEGDNIYTSIDSRKFGAVPYAMIHSRIFWRMLPVRRFGPL